jgi:hypothetical protein
MVRGKVRLNCIQISALQFALRQAHDPTADRITARALIGKLELHRKRAKRATQSQLGAEAYSVAVKQWRTFASWMRYCLFFRPRRRNSIIRMNWRLEVGEVKKAFAEVPEQRGYAALPEAQVERLTKLAMAEIRRKRAGVLLRGDVLARTHDGEEYILEFARKRVELTAVRDDAKPWWQRQSDNGEKFSRSLRAGAAAAAGAQPRTMARQGADKLRNGTTEDNADKRQAPLAPAALTKSTGVSASVPMHFSDSDLINELVEALFARIDNLAVWQALRNDIRFHCDYNPQDFKREIWADSAHELIAKTRPPFDGSTAYELLNCLTEWVMVALFAAGKTVGQVRELANMIAERGEELDEEQYRKELAAAAEARKAIVRS